MQQSHHRQMWAYSTPHLRHVFSLDLGESAIGQEHNFIHGASPKACEGMLTCTIRAIIWTAFLWEQHDHARPGCLPPAAANNAKYEV